MAAETEEHPFDVAKENDQRVNEMLADTDGALAAMQYTGTIGYHIHVADGETDPEYLWRVALLQALDDTVFEMLYVDGSTVTDARDQLERGLREQFDPFLAELIAEQFEDNLRSLIEQQQRNVEGSEVSDSQ